MSVISSFLSELNKRIESNSSQVTDFENKKNVVIEIDNILYKYGLHKEDFTGSTIVKISDEDLKIILETIDDDDIEGKLATFHSSVQIIELFNATHIDQEGIVDDSQLQTAIKYCDQLAKYILEYLLNFDKKNEERINLIKQSIEVPQKYLDMFEGEKLVKPIDNISDLEEFNNLLNTLGFNDGDKAQLKKFVGQSNYKMSQFYSQPTLEVQETINDPLEEYKKILNIKKDTYIEVYNKIKNEKIDFNNIESTIESLSLKYEIDNNTIKQALVCLMLEKNIDTYESVDKSSLNPDEKSSQLQGIIEAIKNVIDFSSKEILSKNDENLINEVLTIINSEKELIASSTQEELNMYLAQNFGNKEDQQTLQYELIAMLLAMKGKLGEFQTVLNLYQKDPLSFKNAKDQKVGDLREIIASYNIIKTKLAALGKIKKSKVKAATKPIPKVDKPLQKEEPVPTEIKSVVQEMPIEILYLVDKEGHALFANLLSNLSKKVRSDYLSIINGDLKAEMAASSKIDLITEYDVHVIPNNDVNLFYIPITSNVMLVITGIIKKDNINDIIAKVVDSYKEEINSIIARKNELQLLFDEQAQIRTEIKTYSDKKIDVKTM